jgi:hypothetical protein
VTPDNHPDPITDGFAQGGQRLVQLISLAAMLRQAHARRAQRLVDARAARDAAEEARISNAMRAEFEQARTRWAPAHDREWLRQADLLQVAEAWAAALAHADDSAAAAAAVGKCEQRLRDMHPHAMQHYDRFRSAGMAPEDAMREAVHFFTRDPVVRTGQPAPQRRPLDEGTDAYWADNEYGPSRQEWEEHRQQQRGHQILEDRVQRDPKVELDKLRTGLVNDTNLPEPFIAAITSRGAADALSGHRPPAEVAADDFPLPISEAMQMTAQQPHQRASAKKPRNPNPERRRRSGR